MADLIRATASPEWSMLDLSHASSHSLQLRLAICPILFTKRIPGPPPGRLRRGARRTPRHAVAFPKMPIVCNRLSAPFIFALFRWGFHHLCFIKIASRGHEQAQSQATTVNQSVPLSIRGRATFTCNSLHEFDYPFSAQGRRKREASTVHHRARPERLHIIRRVRLAPLPSYFSRHSTFPPALYSLFWEACVLT